MKFTATALLCFVASCAASKSFTRKHNQYYRKFTKGDSDSSLFEGDLSSQSWSDSSYSSEEAYPRKYAKERPVGALSKRNIRELSEIVPEHQLKRVDHPNRTLSRALSDYIDDEKTQQLLVERIDRQPDFVATELLTRQPINLLEYIGQLIEADHRILRNDLSEPKTTGTVQPKRTVSLRKRSVRQSRRSKSNQEAALKRQVFEENLELLSERFAPLRDLHRLRHPNERLVKLVAHRNVDLERTLREQVAKNPAYLVEKFLQVEETETRPTLRVREMLSYTA